MSNERFPLAEPNTEPPLDNVAWHHAAHWLRFMEQSHSGLFRSAVGLLVIDFLVGKHKVVSLRRSAPAFRDDVVKRPVLPRKWTVAVSASEILPSGDILVRQRLRAHPHVLVVYSKDNPRDEDGSPWR